MVADGIRGVTANPTILAKAIESSPDYDEQFRSVQARGASARMREPAASIVDGVG